ncbi:MAG TPA: YbaN family protein [Pirellulaceae bacterium]|mgnify:CR=1 FL=1|nr:YbaN family protein [Pirellulaceae bacterium]HMO93891.1 YbaN family protein [Pirellulaceae bacterium]HMP70888.1 YbaN family protein [Pirellulaceae bacterium]
MQHQDLRENLDSAKAADQVVLEVAPRGALDTLRRWILAFAGIFCVGLGAIGAILPGMPTTIFLIMACYLFARSCPVLEKILVRNRFFAAFHQYLDGSAEMPLRAKVSTLVVMWTFICISTVTLYYREEVHNLVAVSVPLAGLVGSFFVLRHGRKSI